MSHQFVRVYRQEGFRRLLQSLCRISVLRTIGLPFAALSILGILPGCGIDAYVVDPVNTVPPGPVLTESLCIKTSVQKGDAGEGFLDSYQKMWLAGNTPLDSENVPGILSKTLPHAVSHALKEAQVMKSECAGPDAASPDTLAVQATVKITDATPWWKKPFTSGLGLASRATSVKLTAEVDLSVGKTNPQHFQAKSEAILEEYGYAKVLSQRAHELAELAEEDLGRHIALELRRHPHWFAPSLVPPVSPP